MDKTYEIHITNSNRSLENLVKTFTDYAKSEWPGDVEVKTS